jgi:two-component system response regulator AtoC
MSMLTAWPWPGNIRELSNVIERAVVMNTGAVIFADDLPDPFRNPVSTNNRDKTNLLRGTQSERRD